jgi:hypothetical protein
VQRFFRRELGFAETAVVFNLNDLLSLTGDQREHGPAKFMTTGSRD